MKTLSVLFEADSQPVIFENISNFYQKEDLTVIKDSDNTYIKIPTDNIYCITVKEKNYIGSENKINVELYTKRAHDKVLSVKANRTYQENNYFAILKDDGENVLTYHFPLSHVHHIRESNITE